MLRAFRSVLPKVHPTAYIDQSAQVIGDVEIGQESSVWMNVVIRGDVNVIRIGNRTNIQDSTVIHVMRGTHATRIGDEVTVETLLAAGLIRTGQGPAKLLANGDVPRAVTVRGVKVSASAKAKIEAAGGRVEA